MPIMTKANIKTLSERIAREVFRDNEGTLVEFLEREQTPDELRDRERARTKLKIHQTCEQMLAQRFADVLEKSLPTK